MANVGLPFQRNPNTVQTSAHISDNIVDSKHLTRKASPQSHSQSNPQGSNKASESALPLRVILLFPFVVIVLILFLFLHHPASRNRNQAPPIKPRPIRAISEEYDRVFVNGCQVPETGGPKANATFVVLARNKELEGVLQSMKSIERHFNRWYQYPYVFLNDVDFNSTFKSTVQRFTSSSVEFGTIDPSMWGFPDWVDPAVAREGIAKQGDAAIMYGGMESYHHMCRFYSGFFYKHPLLLKYKWYWRIEPEIKYFCDITYDPFLKMEEANKTYGFTIAVKELKETVPNLFRYASAFRRKHKIPSKGLWEMFTMRPEEDESFTYEKDWRHPQRKLEEADPNNDLQAKLPKVDPDSMEGEVYNMCHFWSNFEIANLDWFRGREYEEFFQNMDRSGGFWMERWGDAPIHSLAAGALLSPRDVHYFRDIGYRHSTIQHCPGNAPSNQLDRIPYLEETTQSENARREEDDYWATPDKPKEHGVGCRCRCDNDLVEIETKEGSCMVEWVQVAGGWTSP